VWKSTGILGGVRRSGEVGESGQKPPVLCKERGESIAFFFLPPQTYMNSWRSAGIGEGGEKWSKTTNIFLKE
jgi:hypothetical protein